MLAPPSTVGRRVIAGGAFVEASWVEGARTILVTFTDAYDRLQARLDNQPADGPSYRDRLALLSSIDGTCLALEAFHEANKPEAFHEADQTQNDGKSFLPTRAEFQANLDAKHMAWLRDQVARARGECEKIRDSLGFVVTYDPFLKQFDDLPAVARLAFLVDLLTEADKLHDIEAPVVMARQLHKDLSPRPVEPPAAILSSIGDKHVLSPVRLGRLVGDLPFQVVKQADGFHIQLTTGAPASSELEVRQMLGRPTGDLEAVLWALLRRFGDFMTLSIPTLAAATSQDKADKVLGLLFARVFPMLNINGTPAEMKAAMDARPPELRARDQTLYGRIGFPVSSAIGLVGIYQALRAFQNAPTQGQATTDALTAIFSGIEWYRNGLVAIGQGGRVALRTVGTVTGVALFVLDLIAAGAGIRAAVRYGDYSVVVGHALAIGSSAALTGGSIAILFTTGAATGPALIAVGVGVGLFLISQALIHWTANLPLESFATVCFFGKKPTSSDNPGAIEYRFEAGGRAQLETQQERLRTLLNPLGFTITAAGIVDEVKYLRSPAEHKNLHLPESSAFAVRVLAADGSARDWVSPRLAVRRFDLEEFKTKGESRESDFYEEGVRHSWMELEVVLPGDGQSLREYARI